MEITGAYIVRGEIEEINAVEDFIRENTDMTIIYQCSSGGKLYITQEEHDIEEV